MRPFRFRPQPALDLRKKEEETARERLAEAERLRDFAKNREEEARSRVQSAGDALVASQADGSPAWLIGWHRSWIAFKRVEADARIKEAAVSAAAVDRAAASVRAAYQRRRTLERLRDRLQHRHRAAVARHEQRDMDALAGLRFVAQAAGNGGIDGEHEFHHVGDQRGDGHGNGRDQD